MTIIYYINVIVSAIIAFHSNVFQLTADIRLSVHCAFLLAMASPVQITFKRMSDKCNGGGII